MMRGRTRRFSRSEAISLGAMVLGLLVVASYYGMDLLNIGFFSADSGPGDHGEGPLMMIGVSVLSIGFLALLITLAAGWLTRRTRNH